jgi:hypothetical protein
VLDLVFPNLILLTLIPFAVRDLACVLSDEKTGRYAFILTAVCPFLLANGLILVRDAWVASFMALAPLLAIQRRYLWLAAIVAFSFYIRFGTGLLTAFGAAMFLALAAKDGEAGAQIFVRGRRVLGVGILFVAVAIAGIASAASIIGLESVVYLLDRTDFIETYIRASARGSRDTSTLYAIATLPLPVSVPLSTLFFFGSPFLDVSRIFYSGTSSGMSLHNIFVPRAALSGIFALLFVFYAGCFFRGVVRAKRERNVGMLAVALLMVVGLLALSQFSLVLRHKVALQPYFYMLTAYGIGYTGSGMRLVGYVGGLAVAALNLFINIRNLGSL